MTYPDGTFVIYSFDEAGNIISKTDEKYNITTTQYDEMNRPTIEVLADLSETTFEYDNEGNISLLTDSRGNTSSFAFDSENRLTNMIDPNGNEQIYIYNRTGELVKYIDKLGDHTDYSYNSDGQITSTSTSNENVDYTYLSNGRTNTVQNDTLKSTYSYKNETGRIDSVLNESSHYPTNQTVFYDYSNSTGKIVSVRSQNEEYRANYSYGNQDLLTQINSINGEVFIDYDKLLRRSKVRYIGGGVETEYSYNKRNRFSTINHKHNDNTFHSIKLDYDNAGNITSKILNNNLQTTKEFSYSYDSVNQITSESNSFETGSTTFSWDQLGNRLSTNGKSAISRFDKFSQE